MDQNNIDEKNITETVTDTGYINQESLKPQSRVAFMKLEDTTYTINTNTIHEEMITEYPKEVTAPHNNYSTMYPTPVVTIPSLVLLISSGVVVTILVSMVCMVLYRCGWCRRKVVPTPTMYGHNLGIQREDSPQPVNLWSLQFDLVLSELRQVHFRTMKPASLPPLIHSRTVQPRPCTALTQNRNKGGHKTVHVHPASNGTKTTVPVENIMPDVF